MSNKVQPRILPGFMELLPEDQIAFNRMYDTIRSVYERYGFLPLDTPTIELSEVLLAKAGGETEKQIYRFDKGDTDLALRFDLTVPLARYVAQHQQDLVFPFKRYQMSKVFRGERPQKGRFREFYQCDIDVIGLDSLDIVYDAEMPAIICQVFKELDFGSFTIRLNNRKVLNGFFSELGYADKIGDILRTIDKLEKMGKEAVNEELKEFGVAAGDIERILAFIAIKGSNDEVLAALKAQNIADECYQAGVSELEAVIGYLRRFGIAEENFRIDLTIARGLDYYTDQKLPGIGISIGLTRLFYQLKENGLVKSNAGSLARVIVIPMGEDDMNEAIAVAAKVRGEGIPADVYYQQKGMKQKMKYAARLGIPYAAIIGESERASASVMLKNMETGEQEAVPVAELADRIR